jgi:hypothetical protein
MSTRVSLVIRTLVVTVAAFALLLVGLNQAQALEKGVAAGEQSAQTEAGDGGDDVRATERISIPYGFDSTLALSDTGDVVVASGVGACDAGQEITIAFTVTQSATGAMATGVWNGNCTGELQSWTKEGTLATPSPNFSGGEAEACAFAETFAGTTVTDDQDWCDDVFLASENVFLPNVLNP